MKSNFQQRRMVQGLVADKLWGAIWVMPTHPDQQYIDRIRDSLWRPEVSGYAALMIGSGMSLNARAKSEAVGSFPTWAGLTSSIIEELYPDHSCDSGTQNAVKARAQATSEALRLASEYVAAFGEPALERLIMRCIPHQAYEPSCLHERLLRQNWSDVFTTNWDTLLEDCHKATAIRGYSVVHTADDIALSVAPRIVKLHGTLPSSRPFVLTEDHFREYPVTHAPFVNMVQQSIMENTFVLIGFSGDDPNFLHWTGWVRDNLGQSRPQIYLCTFETLTPARRRLLENRRIIPIDLGTIFDQRESGWRAKALEWFIVNLEAGKGSDPDEWPDFRSATPKAECQTLTTAAYSILGMDGATVSL